MNLLVIRNSYIVAGAEIYYLKLQDSFNKFKIDCQIILITNNYELYKKAKDHHIESHLVQTFGEEVGTKKGLLRLAIYLPIYIYKYFTTIFRIKRKIKIDALIISGKTEKYAITPFSNCIKIPIFWLEHGRVFTPTMSRLALSIYKFSSKFCRAIFAESHDTENDLHKNMITDKIIYLGSGVDTTLFSARTISKTDTFTVGFMATICWEKGVIDLVGVIESICNQNLQIKFIILGDGPQLDYLINKCKKYKNVEIVGRIQSVHKYLKRMHVILSPIHHPGGLSLSVQEAMSTGCIPIVTDVGGNRELVTNEVNGFIYSSDFINKASNKIIELSNNYDYSIKLSQAARRQITLNYSNKHLSKKLVNLISTSIINSN